MFCTKCGTKNEDNAKFCTACGANLQEEQPVAPAEPAEPVAPAEPTEPVAPAEPTEPVVPAEPVDSAEPVAPVEPIAEPAAPAAPVAAKMEKSRLVGLIAIVAAAVVVVILAIILFGGRSAKAATKKCVKAFFTGNEKSMARLYHRKHLNELLDIADLDKDELDELFNLDYYMDEFEDEYGDDWEYSYEIEEIDDVSSKELKEIVKSAKKEYGIKVTAAKEAEVEVKIKGEEGKDKLTFYVHLIKSGGSWYVATSYPTWW